MNELDILVDGIIAYGFLIIGYALWVEVFASKELETMLSPRYEDTKTVVRGVPKRHITSIEKAA